MGIDLTILSMFGIVALAGVVVNDSLVMVDFINRRRAAADDLATAVRQAGVVRFRPILLTSLTTFAGLFPLIMEKSLQAQFLIPMAISLAFGVIFSTVITLMLVPSGYMILEDFLLLAGRVFGSRPEDKPALSTAGAALAAANKPALPLLSEDMRIEPDKEGEK
jgi:Cu/Ag efflux pump CusA